MRGLQDGVQVAADPGLVGGGGVPDGESQRADGRLGDAQQRALRGLGDRADGGEGGGPAHPDVRDPGTEHGQHDVTDHRAEQEALVVDVVDLVVVAQAEHGEQTEEADQQQLARFQGERGDGRDDRHQRGQVAVLAGEEVGQCHQHHGDHRRSGPAAPGDVLEVDGQQRAAPSGRRDRRGPQVHGRLRSADPEHTSNITDDLYPRPAPGPPVRRPTGSPRGHAVGDFRAVIRTQRARPHTLCNRVAIAMRPTAQNPPSPGIPGGGMVL